jgi:formate hydrogenlyase subunit 4
VIRALVLGSIVDAVLHVLVLLAVPPLLQGVIVKTKARFGGRVGAPVLQPTSIREARAQGDGHQLDTAAPRRSAVTLTATVARLLCHSAAALPYTSRRPSCLRTCWPWAALHGRRRDTAHPSRMGAAREVTARAGRARDVPGSGVAREAQRSLVSGMLAGHRHAWGRAAPTMVMIVAGMFVIVLAENARIPVDDPSTHLELTMIHEVMVLDHSGPLSASLRIVVKLFAMGASWFSSSFGRPGSLLLDWGVFLAAMVTFAIRSASWSRAWRSDCSSRSSWAPSSPGLTLLPGG